MGIILQLTIDKTKTIRRGQDHFWSVIRQLTETNSKAIFTINDVNAQCAGVSRDVVRKFIRGLVNIGIAEKLNDASPQNPRIQFFRLLRRPLETPIIRKDAASTRGLAQSNMWGTMRFSLKHGFTIRDLVIEASTEEIQINTASAQMYIRALYQAGMLHKQSAGKEAPRYRLKLSSDTGPKAPKRLSTKMIFDPNNKTIVGDVIAEEASS